MPFYTAKMKWGSNPKCSADVEGDKATFPEEWSPLKVKVITTGANLDKSKWVFDVNPDGTMTKGKVEYTKSNGEADPNKQLFIDQKKLTVKVIFGNSTSNDLILELEP